MTPEQRTRLVKLMRMQPWGVNFTSSDQDCIRAALAEIDRLRKHNLDLQRSYDEACSDAAGYESEAVRLRAENDRLTAAIVTHHAQKADDRCIEDDDRLYAAAGLPPCDRRVGDKVAMLANCQRFIERRCEGGGWPSYAELEAERDKWKHLYESQHMPRHEGFKPTEGA